MTGDETGQYGLLLQLAAPLQSWGNTSRFTHKRDTAAAPTRSALIGLIAAALGRRRDESCQDLAPLSFTIRVDRPGTQVRDLHTVGGGMPRHLTVATAEGKRRDGATSTLLSRRYYLQDAVFTVAATASDTALLHRCGEALRHPVWPPYLGRRSCPPSGPTVLTGPVPNVLRHLLHLPLARPAPTKHGGSSARTVAVDFTSDQPLDRLPTDTLPTDTTTTDTTTTLIDDVTGEAQDDPISFTPLDRRYGTRRIHRTTLHLPAERCGGYGAEYLTALHSYIHHDNRTEAS